jgi:hypothetical protein
VNLEGSERYVATVALTVYGLADYRLTNFGEMIEFYSSAMRPRPLIRSSGSVQGFGW